MKNILLLTDSYKASHYLQYPPGTEHISSYIEARKGGEAGPVVFFGLQAYLKEYLSHPFSASDVEEARSIFQAHGEPFNEQGWEYILDKYKGVLPLEIQALEEGTQAPCGIPLVQVVNTDPHLPWLTSYIETSLLRAVWYPTTVASVSARARRLIRAHLELTCEDPKGQLPFRLHDFGARGVSSAESAALGGMAHLINFSGSDTIEGIIAARKYYSESMAGFSIPAAEHSTITSWGEDGELSAYQNMLNQFSGPGKLLAVVSDSWDIYRAVRDIWGDELREQVGTSGGTVVIRPDSGDPCTVVPRLLCILEEKFGVRLNSLGYRVLNPCVRLIQGDGITLQTLPEVLDSIMYAGFSVENVAFGMGGGLLQKLDRDTYRFAMKASAIKQRSSDWGDVYKAPCTDPTKASKAGRQAVVLNSEGEMVAVREDELGGRENLLKTVWRNGKLLRDQTFADVRRKAWGN